SISRSFVSVVRFDCACAGPAGRNSPVITAASRNGRIGKVHFLISKAPHRLGNFRMTGQLAIVIDDSIHGAPDPSLVRAPPWIFIFSLSCAIRHLMQPPAWLLVAVESSPNHLLVPQFEFASYRSSFELWVPPLSVWLVTMELLAPMSSATP